jgi:hypothetical protein
LRPDTFAAPEPLEDPLSILLRNARSLIRNACASVRTCAHRHLRVVYGVEFLLEYGLRHDTTQAPHQIVLSRVGKDSVHDEPGSRQRRPENLRNPGPVFDREKTQVSFRLTVPRPHRHRVGL